MKRHVLDTVSHRSGSSKRSSVSKSSRRCVLRAPSEAARARADLAEKDSEIRKKQALATEQEKLSQA